MTMAMTMIMTITITITIIIYYINIGHVIINYKKLKKISY